ncbi:hypothetical protein [Synechococcus phage BUCT-ZZ01]|nr:hypothetical protein [Synechococcus phage BUCT-ZZ01]
MNKFKEIFESSIYDAEVRTMAMYGLFVATFIGIFLTGLGLIVSPKVAGVFFVLTVLSHIGAVTIAIIKAFLKDTE